MANKIIRGTPGNISPMTVCLLVAGAYLPGLFVTSDGAELTVAAAGTGRLLLLGNAEYGGQDITTAYASGDTGVAYKLTPEMEVYARFDAGTYDKGDPLTVGANGRLVAAASDDVVNAYYDGTDGATLSNGDFADAIIANQYVAQA